MHRFILLIFFLIFSPAAVPAFPAGSHLRLTLHRRPESTGISRLEILRTMIHGDRRRQRMISDKIGRRRRVCSVPPSPAIEMPVWSGAYTGTGQYFVRVRLGTPAKPFLLVTDTGSDLTWVTCRYHGGADSPAPSPDDNGGGGRRSKRVFKADLSRSFRPILCSSDLCRTELPFSLSTCPTPASPCAYDYQYAEGSSAQGIFANESATVELLNRHRMKLKGLIIGCTSTSVGSSFISSDGVLALGYGPNTFVSRATAKFGNLFSYCFVDHLSPRNATGHLTFGPNPDLFPHSPSARLILEPKLQPFYYVSIAGISVAGELLRIPASVWNDSSGGGAILDSGTTLTVLAEPAYKAVVSAISTQLINVPRVEIDPFEYCYNWTTAAAAAAAVPDLTVHFTGSGNLTPPRKSYLIDVADGVKCIGFSSTPWPGVSTIGNILQQEHIWEFDLKNQRLRFHRSNCTQGSFYH
ncbi:hypothetical protein IEQ34_008162 [Dendrobium chrysotoxum]|uniref:Peptidase A1 domain-containing protein n=1 Tax=Dendrobium chrysotoxum TaxID=161865 RepID=A0AAV7H7U9_DENCH|nr:hypothetical protein IEQ34_008162 [Dendrobium chrysotoxum]